MFKNLIFINLCVFSFLNSAIAMEPTSATSNNKIIVDAQSRLIEAAKTNNLTLFKELVGNYTEPLARIMKDGQNLLHIAAANNAMLIVKYLVENLYFDVQLLDAAKNAAIDLAKSKGHIPMVDYLALMWEKQTKKRTAQEEEAEFEALCDQFAQEAQLNCTICFDDKPQADFCTLPCGHQYCTGCLNEQLDVAIKAHDSSSLCCPNPKCKRAYDNAALAKITTDKTKITAIDEIKLQESIAQDPNAKHCPTPECKYAFINENKIPVNTQCPRCKAEYCSQCLTNHAMNISCENAKNDKANEQWKKENTKACPQCKVAIEKNEGCLHMTCKQCKHEFCWKCMQPYKQKGHGPFNCTLAPAANNAPAATAQPAPLPVNRPAQRPNLFVRNELRLNIDFNLFASNPMEYNARLPILLQNTNFSDRFIALPQPYRLQWVTEISERSLEIAMSSPNRQACIWLQELERIEQSISLPRRAPYAFISDNPGRFIHINFANAADPIDPVYIIEFTQKENRIFARRFLDFIRPFFPENERYFISTQPYMGEETVEIQRTSLNEREIQAIIDQANAHLSQQQNQTRRFEESGRE